MKLLVFGATGGTGREVLKQALDRGHEVMAFVRDPAGLQEIQHGNLYSVAGNVLDPAAVASAVPGHDAVLFAIGAGPRRSTVREEGKRPESLIEHRELAGWDAPQLRRMDLESLLAAASRPATWVCLSPQGTTDNPCRVQ